MEQNNRAHFGRTLPTMGKLAGLLAMAFSLPAQAILINDRAAAAAGGVANYWDRNNQHSAVVSLFAPIQNQSGCTGTLINSRTILTAAHCLTISNEGLTVGTDKWVVRFGADSNLSNAEDRDIIGAQIHERFRDDLLRPDGSGWLSAGGDIALITLSAPVTSIAPVELLRPGQPRPGPGALMQMIGYGNAGNGSGTENLDDSKRRVAQTILGFYDRVHAQDLAPMYSAQFRNPESPSNPDRYGISNLGIAVPHLQGSANRGDSGGPLFWLRPDGTRVQVGTTTGARDSEDALYGVTALWTSVADYAHWIDLANPLRSVTANAGVQRWSDADIWTDKMGRHETPDNRNGVTTGALGKTGRFYQAGLVAPGRMTVDIDPTIDTLAVLGSKATLALPAGRKLKVIDQAALARGPIELDGRLEAKRFDMSGGVLAGTGTLLTSHGAIATGGVVAPGGADIGTLSISGNYTHGGDAVLAVGAREGVSDRLAVSGNAVLTGGTLAVMAGKGVYRTDVDYEILAAASLQGTFAHVRSDLAFLAPAVAHGPTAARLKLARNGTSFASVAEPNHAGIAASADRLGQGSDLYRALASSDAVQARQAFGQLSGESLAGTTSHAIDHTRYLREAAITRLRDASQGAWAQTFGTWGRMASGNGTASQDSATQGLMGGLDHAFSASTRAGIAASFARGTLSVAERAGSSTVDSYDVLLHASHQRGSWRLRGGGGFGINDVASQRTPSMLGFSDKNGARYRLPIMQVFGEAGYALQFGAAQVEPFFNLAHVRTRATEFTERGGAAALRGRLEAQQATLTTTGLRVNWHLEDSAGGQWNVDSALGWRHALRNSAPKATTGFVAGGDSGTVRGAALSGNRLALQLDVSRSVGVNSRLGLTYGGEWASHAQDHVLRATWRHQF